MTFFIEDYFRDCKQKSASYSLFVKKKEMFRHFLSLFIIFMTFFDEVSNFRNRNLSETRIGDEKLSVKLHAARCSFQVYMSRF